MVSFTTNKALAQPTVSSDSGIWGGELNTGVMAPLDLMLGGADTINLSSTTYTLSSTEIQNLCVKCVGTLLANVTVYSSCVGFYIVENSTTGSFTVTWQANFGSGGVGTAWNIPQGSRTMFVSDTAAGARPVCGDVAESLRHAGNISPFAGSSAPYGSLLCYGQAVSRTIYSYLFSAISTTFGVGDGSTTFNVPDLRGRAIFGLDNMGGSAAGRLTGSNTGNITAPTTLGGTGGEENHTQTLAELVSHGHTDSGHLHYFTAALTGQGTSFTGPGGGSVGDSTQNTGVGYANILNSGGGGSHNTTPPGIVMNWVIKT